MTKLLQAVAWLVLGTPLILVLCPLDQVANEVLLFDSRAVQRQRVLICGASSGIGEQLALRYSGMPPLSLL